MKRVVRASSHVRTPWKNGGGSTIQLAISPRTAGLDDFEWRISMATVASGVSAEVPSVVYLMELTQGTFGAASAPGGSRKGSIGMRS